MPEVWDQETPDFGRSCILGINIDVEAAWMGAMDFSDALHALRDACYVGRRLEEEEYAGPTIKLVEVRGVDSPSDRFQIFVDNVTGEVWMPSMADLLADDWEGRTA